MNPKITITVDAKNKAVASFDGIASVGAKIDVEVHGLPSGIIDFGEDDDWSGPSLRLRILDDDGNDIVRFPLEKKTSTKVIGGDQWTKTAASGADTYANKTGTIVDFDTEGLRAQFDGESYDTTKSFGIVLDSSVDKAEFAVGKIKISQWLTASVDDPTVVPGWEEIKTKLDNATVSVTKVGDTATISITDTHGATTTATVTDGAKGDKGDTGDTGPTGAAIVSQVKTGEDAQGNWIYTQTFDDGTTQTFTTPKGEKGDHGDGSYIYDESDQKWHLVKVFTDPITGDKTTWVDQNGISIRPGVEAPTLQVVRSGSHVTLTTNDGVSGTMTAIVNDGVSSSASVSKSSADQYGNRTTTISCITGPSTTTASVQMPDIQIVSEIPQNPELGVLYFVIGA